MVNDNLGLMANNVLQTSLRQFETAVYYTVIMDAIADNSMKDQVSFFFHNATQIVFS